jgi:hypothetical protein
VVDVLDKLVDQANEQARPPNWRITAIDYSFWLLSRAILVSLIVVCAFVFRVPFERLITGEAVHQMVEAETQKQVDQFKFVDHLSVAASTFESSFADSIECTQRYEQTPDRESRMRAESKVKEARSKWNDMKAQFEARTTRLNDDIERDVQNLITDGETGLKAEDDALRSPGVNTLLRQRPTFACHETLVHEETEELQQFEKSYVRRQQRTF